MKVSSNKSSKKSSVKSDAKPLGNKENKPRFSVEEISNGFIVEKSRQDENYNYKCVKTYHEKNPLAEVEKKK